MTCSYITVLDRPCGRQVAEGNEHCAFHESLVRLEAEFEQEMCR